ncbi:hypothetical protein [Kitasatospora sp. NPDC088346]|uniref:hypothetical protein n=1 Tax=Kitasatospora sp. NPDC088346 TaxID=3364073 RepID=UPI003827B1CE
MSSRLGTGLQEHLGGRSGDGLDEDGSLSPDVLRHLPDSVRLELAHVYADSLHAVFHAVIPVVLVGLVIALLLKDTELGGGHDHGRSRPERSGEGTTAVDPSAARSRA